jgi:glycosyltransferase involved in cell wall biosynthesis
MARVLSRDLARAGVRTAPRISSSARRRGFGTALASRGGNFVSQASQIVKIAVIVPGGVDRSGEYRVIPVLLALLARLAARNEVHVFALHQERGPASWDLAGAHIHNIGVGFTVPRAIQAICAEHRASPLHLVQSLWSGTPGSIAVAAAKILRLPCLIHVAGGELAAIADIGYGGRRTWLGRVREATLLRAATVVSAASAPMIEALAALGISAQRLPLGVDQNFWPPQQPVRRDLGKPARLIHVASLNRVKDQATLLRALASLSATGAQFHMDIVGEDTLQGEMQAFAVHLGLAGQVTFHGFLPQKLLLPLMRQAHLLIVSSRHEAGPMVVLEAGIEGVPTVGTAVGHIAEWAPHAAIAVTVGDWAGLARAIVSVLVDEDLRLNLARRAVQLALDEDADCMAKGFLALYANVLNSNALDADAER